MCYSVLPDPAMPNQAKINQTMYIMTPGYIMLLSTKLYCSNLVYTDPKKVITWCGGVG